MKIEAGQTPAFKSGLTRNLIKDFRQIDIKNAEADFKSAGIDANFKGSKTFCGCSTIVCNIMNTLSGKFHLPFDSLPPAIRVFKKKEAVQKLKNTYNFCISDTEKIIEKEPPFIGKSIFFREQFLDSPLALDLLTFDYFFDNKISASHFLSVPMHEWFHNIHLDLIYKKHGYESDCPVMKSKYRSENADGAKTIDELVCADIPILDKFYLEENFGEYSASGNLMETFAEIMTKITTQSLDKKLNVIKNPLDNLPKDLPKFIKDFLEKTLNI